MIGLPRIAQSALVMSLGAVALITVADVGAEAAAPPSSLTPVLLDDINTTEEGSFLYSPTELNGRVLFGADGNGVGYELFAFDMGSDKVELVKDIFPGPEGNGPGTPTIVGDTAYFAANDGESGNELWKTDGTTSGTMLVADIFPGAESSDPQSVIAVGDDVFFSATDSAGNHQVWRSSGAVGNATPVTDEAFTRAPSQLTAVALSPTRTVVYFQADTAAVGSELFRYDPDADTLDVVDFNPGAGDSHPFGLSVVDDTLFAVVRNATNESELIAVSGTPPLTVENVDVGDTPRALSASSDKLWVLTRPDGSDADSSIVRVDLDLGVVALIEKRKIREIVAFGDDVLFSLDQGGGEQPFVGGDAGIEQLAEVEAGGRFPRFEFSWEPGTTAAYFAVPDIDENNAIWRTDGTLDGTYPLTPPEAFDADRREILELSDKRVVMSVGWHGENDWEPTLSDGEEEDARQLANLRVATSGSSPRNFTAFGPDTVFEATEPTNGGALWIHRSATDEVELFGDATGPAGDVTPAMLGVVGPTMFARVDFNGFGEPGGELVRFDGTSTTPTLLTSFGDGGGGELIGTGFVVNDRLFFQVLVDVGGPLFERQLWVSDGTAAGTRFVSDERSFSFATPLAFGDRFVFSLGQSTSEETWISDGTMAGTFKLFDRGRFSQAVFGDHLYYRNNSGDPRRTDGTVAGSVAFPLLDGPADPLGFFSDDQRLYVFSVDDGEPVVWWTTDPDAGFTQAPTDGESSGRISTSGILPATVGDVLIAPLTKTAGKPPELLVFDGARSTIFTLPGSSATDQIREVVAHPGGTYLRVGSDSADREVWVTDGTQEGTVPIPLESPHEVGDPFTFVNDWIYFTPSVDGIGTEPHAVQLPSPAIPEPEPEPESEPSGPDVVSLAPGRVLDTRGVGETVDDRFEKLGRVEAGGTVVLDVLGRADVPSVDVGSVVLNVTMIRPDGNGFVSIFPCGDRPNASSMNAPNGGGVVANEVIAKVSDAGTVCLFSSVGTDLAADVTGFVPAASGVVSLAPGRVLDTRANGETVDDVSAKLGKVEAGGTVELQVLGRAGVPATGVGSVVLNVTMIRPDGNGFVSIFPCGDRPNASSMNAPNGGGVVANEVIAKVSDAGTVCLFSSVGTDLAADVTGFVPSTSGVVSLAPGRVLDTRANGDTVDDVSEKLGKVEAGDTVELQVLGRAGVPDSGVGSVVLNVTMIRPDGNGFVSIFPCGDRPNASSMNAPNGGGVVANEVIAKVSSAGTVCLFASVGTDLAADVTGYIAAA